MNEFLYILMAFIASAMIAIPVGLFMSWFIMKDENGGGKNE